MYDPDKTNYFEIIISERVSHYYSEDLYNEVSNFLQKIKDENKHFRAIACKEQGTKENKWHVHIACHFPPLFSMKDSTFRDKIRKHFGKSNTTYDWKKRKVKSKGDDPVEDFIKYVTKNGDCVADVDFFEGVFEKYKGTYKKPVKPTQSAKKIAEKIPIKRCQQCIEWNQPFCKKDCWDAVVDYYEREDKVFYLYRMIALAHTLYYRDQKDELWHKVQDKI